MESKPEQPLYFLTNFPDEKEEGYLVFGTNHCDEESPFYGEPAYVHVLKNFVDLSERLKEIADTSSEKSPLGLSDDEAPFLCLP